MTKPIAETNNDPSVDEFWQLSTRFYDAPEVSRFLLALQNTQQKNINELLFALWVSHALQIRLTDESIQRILQAAERNKLWAANIRDTRFDLEQQWQPPYPEKIDQARQAMLHTELNIERLHQQKLVEALGEEMALHTFEKCADYEILLMHNLTACCGMPAAKSDYLQLIALWQEFLLAQQ